MAKTVLLFSGQGSQYPGMGVSFAEAFPAAREIFEEASEILGFDLYKKCAEAPEEELSSTVISQPAIMAVSLCAAEALREKGVEAEACAGHSLGEYAAMVYTGMVTRADGFMLIKARSEAMQRAAEAAKGAMYAIIGKDADEVEKACEEIEGYVIPVNYNSPVQTVIAGEEGPAKAAADKLAQAGARAIRLNVSSAFHSKLMQPAADEFVREAKKITISPPNMIMMSNVSGGALENMENLADRLAWHMVSPVKFTSELYSLNEKGFDRYVECGPGKVLTGLVKKTLPGVEAVNVQDTQTLEKALARLK